MKSFGTIEVIEGRYPNVIQNHRHRPREVTGYGPPRVKWLFDHLSVLTGIEVVTLWFYAFTLEMYCRKSRLNVTMVSAFKIRMNCLAVFMDINVKCTVEVKVIVWSVVWIDREKIFCMVWQ